MYDGSTGGGKFPPTPASAESRFKVKNLKVLVLLLSTASIPECVCMFSIV